MTTKSLSIRLLAVLAVAQAALLGISGVLAASPAGAQADTRASEPLVVPDLKYPETGSGPLMIVGVSFHPIPQDPTTPQFRVTRLRYGLAALAEHPDFSTEAFPTNVGLASATFHVPRLEKFRVLHVLDDGFVPLTATDWADGALTPAEGLLLWDDDGNPLSRRVPVIDEEGVRLGELRLRISLQHRVAPTVETCSIDLDFGQGQSSPRLFWTGQTDDMRLELWYDDQPFLVDGLDASAGQFDLLPDVHHFKLNTFARLELVNVIGTGDDEQRIATSCWRTNLRQPRWSIATCTVNLSDGTLRALTADGAPVDLYSTSQSFTPILTGIVSSGPGGPAGVDRTDIDDFPAFYRTQLTTDQLATVANSDGAAGIRTQGRHTACAVIPGSDALPVATAVESVFGESVDLATAAAGTVDPQGTRHLLDAAKRLVDTSSEDFEVVHVLGGEARVKFSRYRETTFVRRGDEWKLSTRGLCEILRAKQSWERQLLRQSCPDLVRQPDALSCVVALRTTEGRCGVHGDVLDELYGVARKVFGSETNLAEASQHTVDAAGTRHLLPWARKVNRLAYKTPAPQNHGVRTITETHAVLDHGGVVLVKQNNEWKVSYRTLCRLATERYLRSGGRSAFLTQSCRALVVAPSRFSCVAVLQTASGRCQKLATDAELQAVAATDAIRFRRGVNRQRHLDVLDADLRNAWSLMHHSFRLADVKKTSDTTATVTLQAKEKHTIRVAKRHGYWRLSVADLCTARRAELSNKRSHIKACDQYVK